MKKTSKRARPAGATAAAAAWNEGALERWPLFPSLVPLPDTAPDDPRLGQLILRAQRSGGPPRVALVGFPTDVGVRRNGGRPGAALAPVEIRRHLYRLTPDPRRLVAMRALLLATRDLGDLAITGDLEADQRRLGELVAFLLRAGVFPIVLGGGHETAYGHFLGYAGAALPVTLLNWDAHTDVREPVAAGGHSGSPFRQALQHPSGMARRYLVAGLQPQSVAAPHLAFVQAHGQAFFRDELSASAVPGVYASAAGRRTAVLASFDIDAVDQGQSPGVSAPASGGLATDLWLAAAYQAGRHPAVRSCDLVEANPTQDRDGQTARLAALTVWSVLAGLADRGPAAAPRRR